ncbi:MAG: N-acetyltransferase [Mesorhizobium sp.]|uniref:GNAT family N-acetyltransferase n=1 Tax=Mesorhizobium sp. TaxID=1871066 RepID=UPI000FE77B24|nr:N-acetyltransferase [Mesorhizobium sp.]RWH49132.1 MAG: N-acetyltransferase [Mesorhizobium sp.]
MINIRNASSADLEAISRLHIESAQQTFAHILPQNYLFEKMPTELRLSWQERLVNPSRSEQHLVLVAETASREICGLLAVGFDDKDPWGAFIHTLHVDATQHRRGIARRLLIKAVAQFPNSYTEKGVHLLVYEQNLNARAVYERLGGVVKERMGRSAYSDLPIYSLRYVWSSLSAFRWQA